MTALMRGLIHATVGRLFSPAARTSTANGTGADMQDYEGTAIATLDVGAVSGTAPTLDVKLQHSDTQGGTYTDITGATFAQVTAADVTANKAFDVGATTRWVRAVATIAGTSPSFLFGVTFQAKKKYL